MQSEWLVFTIVVAMASAFLLIYTPLRSAQKDHEDQRVQQEQASAASREKNTKAITELNTSLKMFAEQFEKMEEDNHESHRRLYDRLAEEGKVLTRHEAQLREHERRLETVERMKGND